VNKPLSLVLFACYAGLSVSSSAADAESGRTEERFIPNYAAGEASFLWSAPAALESTPGTDMAIREVRLSVPVPLLSNESSRLVTGVDVRWTALDFDGPSPFGKDLNLYRVQVPLDFWHSFNDRWKAWGRVAPGLFTDFRNLDDDAFAVTVLALASYQIVPEFSAAFGAYYSRDLGEDRVLPALGLIWKPDLHWNIGLTFPRASVAYAPTDEWLFSLQVAPGGSGWSITDEVSGGNRRLDYKSWRAGLGVEHAVARVGPARLWAFLSGGVELGRELSVHEGDAVRFETGLENGPFFSGGIRLRF